ncbi:HAD-IB family hydrolase [Catenovulum sp. SM1970]|uniref:HAD family hydrolase n=1 Tax=Marinifaba aquimaris TaxID=2741323 RepID=UPI0015741A1A|nr:HAD-IB family hydrolase [Marinifaba aquimaris]NTS75310.1 HAD-IB family hydrolase [Marinifaba aquimaris]
MLLNIKKRAAFFDVDDTLISVKSLVSFVQYLNDNNSKDIDLPSMSVFLKNLYNGLNNGTPRSELNRYYFSIYKGISTDVVEQAAYNWFVEQEKNDNFYIESSINELQRLAKEGYQIVLVTGSFMPLLKPLQERLPINHIIHTTPEIINNHYTGELIGAPCIGSIKRTKVLEFALKHNIDLKNSWAFGDDDSDIPMLQTVGHGIRVEKAFEQSLLENCQ